MKTIITPVGTCVNMKVLRRSPKRLAKILIPIDAKIIVLNLELNKLAILCGSVRSDNSSIIPTIRIQKTIVKETSINIPELIIFVLIPFVLAKSESKVVYRIAL